MYYIYDDEIWYEDDKLMLIDGLVDGGMMTSFEDFLDDNYTAFEIFDTINQNGATYGINLLYNDYDDFCEVEFDALVRKGIIKVVYESEDDDDE